MLRSLNRTKTGGLQDQLLTDSFKGPVSTYCSTPQGLVSATSFGWGGEFTGPYQSEPGPTRKDQPLLTRVSKPVPTSVTPRTHQFEPLSSSYYPPGAVYARKKALDGWMGGWISVLCGQKIIKISLRFSVK
jgi:hypothetical protein